MKNNIFFLMIWCILYQNSIYAYYYEYTGDCVALSNFELLENCLNKELSKYDAQLNRLYKKMNRAKIKDSENVWIKFKIADCEYMAAEVQEGFYYPFVYKACLINKTKERIADLNRSFFHYHWFKEIEEQSV